MSYTKLSVRRLLSPLTTAGLLSACFLLGATLSPRAHANTPQLFTTSECLKANFDISVYHGAWPMGLIKTTLGLNKKFCELTVTHRSKVYKKAHYTIDVCRAPVHIKEGEGNITVLKRKTTQEDGSKTVTADYLGAVNSIFEMVQDDGLIFAPGEKEKLSDHHGMVYCSYLLLQKYLSDGFVFNKYLRYPKGLIHPEAASELPFDQKLSAPSSEPDQVQAQAQAPTPEPPTEASATSIEKQPKENEAPQTAPKEKSLSSDGIDNKSTEAQSSNERHTSTSLLPGI